MKIDCQTFLEPKILPVESLLKKMDKEGITKCVLIPKITKEPIYQKSQTLMSIQRLVLWTGYFSFLIRMMDKSFHSSKGEWNPWYRKFLLKTQAFEIVQKPDNYSTLKAIKEQPGRFLGWIFLNPLDNSYLEELENFIAEKQMIGVWAHPFWHRYPLHQLNELMQILENNNLPITITLGHNDSTSSVEKFCSKYPNVKVIFAHAAFPLYKKAWPIIKKSQNKYVDLTTHHVNKNIAIKAINFLGYQKCIFGSGDPYGDIDAGEKLSRWIDGSSISNEQKNAILYKNFNDIIVS